VVHVLVVLGLHRAFPKGNAFRNEDARAACMLEVREGALGNCDGEARIAGEQSKLHFRFHVIARTISRRLIEASRKLHEQLARKARVCPIVIHGQHHLGAGSADPQFIAEGYMSNVRAWWQRAAGLERAREKLFPACLESIGVRGKFHFQMVSERPINSVGLLHSVHRSVVGRPARCGLCRAVISWSAFSEPTEAARPRLHLHSGRTRLG